MGLRELLQKRKERTRFKNLERLGSLRTERKQAEEDAATARFATEERKKIKAAQQESFRASKRGRFFTSASRIGKKTGGLLLSSGKASVKVTKATIKADRALGKRFGKVKKPQPARQPSVNIFLGNQQRQSEPSKKTRRVFGIKV